MWGRGADWLAGWPRTDLPLLGPLAAKRLEPGDLDLDPPADGVQAERMLCTPVELRLARLRHDDTVREWPLRVRRRALPVSPTTFL